MSRPVTIICDKCGKTKGESNHWWTVIRDSDVSFTVWTGVIDAPGGKDICGETCLTAYISGLLAELTK